MALQRIPWMVNGGSAEGQQVEHSAVLARQQNFASLGGQTGIVSPDSMEVVAGDVPGGFVDILPGSGTITYAQGVDHDRAYASAQSQLVPVRNETLTRVEIAPTSSAGGRVDMVCVEINDPELEGTAGSVDFGTHEFVRVRVVQNVAQDARYPWELSSLPRPLLPLARVHIPASTATITDEMIRDIRFMSVARSEARNAFVITPTTKDVTSSTFEQVISIPGIRVPQWATHGMVSGMLSGAQVIHGTGTSIIGQVRTRLNPDVGGLRGFMTFFREDSGVNQNRIGIPLHASFHVYKAERGKHVELVFDARRTGGGAALRFGANHTRFDVQITFQEEPVLRGDG